MVIHKFLYKYLKLFFTLFLKFSWNILFFPPNCIDLKFNIIDSAFRKIFFYEKNVFTLYRNSVNTVYIDQPSVASTVH